MVDWWTPIFAHLLDSSLMSAQPATRWLFLTMTLLADQAGTGIVDMPAESLAARAHLTLDQTLAGLDELKKPDPTSSCQLEDGRRIVALPRPEGFEERGWRLPSWPVHKAKVKASIRRRQVAEAVRRHRLKADVSNVKPLEDSIGEEIRVEKKKDSPPTPPGGKRARFVVPTVEEIQAEIDRMAALNPGRCFDQINAEDFFVHYEKVGWKTKGGTPLIKWKMAVIEWEKNRRRD